MPRFTTTYLLPAILLNPAVVLHLINTIISHATDPLIPSVSPNPSMESLGPLPGMKPRLDMHASDQLCLSYTAVMVAIQMLVFGRVQKNRINRRKARAKAAGGKGEASMDTEAENKWLGSMKPDPKSGLYPDCDGAADVPGEGEGQRNGRLSPNGAGVKELSSGEETSEEEMML